MSPDLHDLLVVAAECENGEPDLDGGWRRGRRLRHRRRVIGLVEAGLCVVAVSTATLIAFRSPVTPRVTTSEATGTPYTDPTHRFSVTIPDGWYRADGPLVPYVIDPEELLSVGTYPLSLKTLGPACDAQLPKNAIDQLGPTDVYVLVDQSHESGQLPNPSAPIVPSQFPARPDNFAAAQFQPVDCSGPTWSYPLVHFQRIFFQDHGRVIGVFVAWGNAVPQERQAQTWQLLNSLRFAP